MDNRSESWPKNCLRSIGRRVISKEEWEALKPLIQRIYIDQNKSFPYLAGILAAEHGFHPTKRQFSRKVEEWGFRENVPRSERLAILQSLSSSSRDDSLNIKDRRFKPGRVERWQRQQRKEGHIVQCGLTPNLDFRGENLGQHIEIPAGSADYTCQGDIADLNLIADRQDRGSTYEPIETCHETSKALTWDQWPISWADVDVPGSPGLTRLFNALELECLVPIPSLALDASSSENSKYISDNEMLDLFNGRSSSSLNASSNTCNPKSPMGVVESEFYEWHGSPTNEIYVFPSFRSEMSRTILDPRKLSWQGREKRENELHMKLSKLKSFFHADHCGIIETIAELAHIHWRLYRTEKAALLYKRVLDARLRTLGPLQPTTLEAYVKILNAFQACQWNIKEAAFLHRIGIVEHQNQFHELNDNRFYKYILDENFRRPEKIDELYRQVLQIRLTNHGPRDYETLETMWYLGISLIDRKHVSEGTKLIRMVVQLQPKVAEADNFDMGKAMLSLSIALQAEKRYEESNNIDRYMKERSKELFDIQGLSVFHENAFPWWRAYYLATYNKIRGVFEGIRAL